MDRRLTHIFRQLVWLLLLPVAGCACCDPNACHRPPKHCRDWAVGFPCHGFHPTCWRPWPEECPPCPSFAAVPPVETIAPGPSRIVKEK